jgi:hypothetical protein
MKLLTYVVLFLLLQHQVVFAPWYDLPAISVLGYWTPSGWVNKPGFPVLSMPVFRLGF